MDKTIVMERIINIFRKISEVEDITEDSSLIDDLEISSLESFVALGELEEAFRIRIPEKKVIQMVTIRDVYSIVTDITQQ